MLNSNNYILFYIYTNFIKNIMASFVSTISFAFCYWTKKLKTVIILLFTKLPLSRESERNSQAATCPLVYHKSWRLRLQYPFLLLNVQQESYEYHFVQSLLDSKLWIDSNILYFCRRRDLKDKSLEERKIFEKEILVSQCWKKFAIQNQTCFLFSFDVQ